MFILENYIMCIKIYEIFLIILFYLFFTKLIFVKNEHFYLPIKFTHMCTFKLELLLSGY